jgi:hypothetical protein
VFSRPFGLIWTLYAATYTVANGTESVAKEAYPPKADLITFASTFLVNVPLGVWKDVRFAQLFGSCPDATAAAAKTTARTPSRVASVAVTATFLLRDGVTIFGSFTLAPYCTPLIPDYAAGYPHSKTVVTQIFVPVLSQLVATPLHLLGLDLYSRPYQLPWSDRLAIIRRNLRATTVMRCVRIVPAFGFGCLANMGLRSLAHDSFVHSPADSI